MGYAECENYYIEEKSLKIILAGLDVQSFYGFLKSEAQDEITKEDIHKSLAYLYQEEYVTWENGSIVLLEPLNSLAKIAVNAVNCIQIDYEGVSKVCYGGGEKVLVTEWGNHDHNKIRFSIWKIPEFLESLWEMQVFPEEELEDAPDLKAGAKDIKAVFALKDKKTGQSKCTMEVFEEGVFTYISLKTEEEENISLYNKEQIENIFGDWFRMEVQK